MAKQLTVDVKPKTVPGSKVSLSLFVRLKYTREVPSDNQEEAAPKTIKLEGSHRQELDGEGKAELIVDDYANSTTASLQVEMAQGMVLWESDDFTPKNSTASIIIPDTVFASASKRKTPSDVAVLSRTGRFVKLDDSMPNFSGYRLHIAAIRPAKLPGNITNPQTKAVRKILGLADGGELTSFEMTVLKASTDISGAINTVGLQSAVVRADGTFDISIDIVADEIGWLWLLLGPVNYAGYQLDALPTRPRFNVVIVLPQVDSGTGGSTGVSSSSGSSGCNSGNGNGDVTSQGNDSPPMDFDERQLVDHPDLFSDDPGKFCTPFENPQRILGERRFFTVLRIDQPEIGGLGSLKVSRPIVLDLASPVRMSAVKEVFGKDSSLSASTPLSKLSAMRLSFASVAQPRLDERAMLNRNVFKPARNLWTNWIRDRSKLRAPVSDNNPIEWEGDPTIYQAASVAGGHVLEWRVRWRSNGYSLGNVAHTLTLAPRQTKRIARISWERRETAARREMLEVSDALTQVTTRARDYSDAVKSSLSEWSRGGSKSRTTGVAGGIGFALGPVVIGGGAAHGSASSSSWQTGGRRVAAAEHQELRDAIRQYGESTRRLESTVITEVSQEETVEGVTETLRNINYRHALTVLYYEILRHLRVDTEFAGLRECLFVPFSITPFDVEKALKWREQLRQGMLDPSLRWALDRLDEVATAWADSDIPPGRRSQHNINYISGSIYIQLSVERPRDSNEDEAAEDYYPIWTRLAPILGHPVRRIVEIMTRTQQNRDVYFQREVAPTMAARWANWLELELSGNTLSGADFTLATSYRFGGTVRIDFTLPVTGSLNREQLQEITVRAAQPLPVGSVANVKSMSIHYYTDHFDRRVDSDRGARDLIEPSTGEPDAGGGIVHLPLSAWERQNLREVIEDGVEKLITHLNANLVYYHKVIWWLMDRDELYILLDGFIAPYGRRFEDGVWVEDTGRSLASVVERDPMAILGNTLVFRVAAGTFLGIDGHTSPEAAHRYYYDSQVRTEPLRVSLPTEGLYAQALMDKCEACEEYNGGTEWVLTQGEPELEALADQLGTRRAAPEELTPTKIPETIISLQNAPSAPDPTGLAGVLSAVTKPDAFRDMAGLAGTQSAAQAAMSQAASLASGFGQAAVDLQKSREGTKDAKKKLDNINKAKSDGLIDQAEAEKQASRVLDGQNMTSAARKLTEEPTVNQAIKKASESMMPIEVSRQSKDGIESMKVGPVSQGVPIEAKSEISGPTVLGPVAPGTNPGSTLADAMGAISTFSSGTGALKFNVTRNQIVTRLSELVANPDIVDQGDLNVCGPAAVLRTVLRRDPKLVAEFCAELAEQGKGKFGRILVEPCSDLRNQTYQASWGCPIAEWVIMSSLRDDENWLFDFEGTPGETLSAATIPGEIEDWLKATGLYSSVRDEANLVVTENVAHIMGLKVDNNTDNILLIHSHMLRNAPVSGTAPAGAPGPASKKSDEFILNSFPNHWVILTKKPTESGGRLKFSVWSWGNYYDVDIPVATFEANYYGAVIAVI